MAFHFETRLRPRYAETDRMGYVYYGYYLTYFEVARTEAIRNVGISYRELEEQYNVMLPVAEAHINYRKPATYDQILILKTSFPEEPDVKVRFDTQIFNEEEQLLAEGYVTLVFVDKESRRPCRPPQGFIDALTKYKNSQI